MPRGRPKGYSPPPKMNRMHSDMVRRRIQVMQIINRLQKHVDGEVEMSQTQVSAAKVLLDKSLSNAATDVNLSGGVTVNWPLGKSALDV